MADQNQTGGPPPEHDNRPIESQSRQVSQYQPQQTGMGQSAGAMAVSTRNESAAAMLAAREAKAIEVRALMAERNPRNIDRFREGVLMACKRVGFADMAMYEKPVGGGKTATGLSVRFAEEAIRHWRNAEVSVSVIAEDDESRTLEAVATDFETNIVYRTQARVAKFVWRLSPKQGDEILGQKVNSRGVTTYKIRADEDALFTTERAAAAKARREVTLNLMPSDILEECESQIEKTLEAIGGDPVKFLVRLLEKFSKVGVVREQLERLTGKDLGVLNVAELRRLDRIRNAIAQGETDWETVMAESAAKKGAPAAEAKTEGAPADTKSGADKLRGAAKAAAPAKPGEDPAAGAPAKPADQAAPAETKAPAAKPAPAAKTTKTEPAKGPPLQMASQEGPAIASKDCVDCGAEKGQPHETECPLA